MDNIYEGKRTAVRKKLPRKNKPAQKGKSADRRDRRRLLQLLVSAALFFVVFAGRGVFAEHIQAWDMLIRTDADLGAAFRTFGQAIADDESVGSALKTLGVTVFGGQTVSKEPDDDKTQPPQTEIIPLSQTGKLGLERAREYGVMKLLRAGGTQEPEQEPEPEPTPQVVTAVAQAYGENGEALPSNVSFAHYELGLDKTAVPVLGEVTSGFGYRTSPMNGKREFHLALDIAASEGTKIGAFADGVVEYIGESDEFGLYLKITHDNGVSSFYAHCSKLLVRKGESVTCGQTVALVGSTGNATGAHLHLTIEKDNIRLDPAYYVDPS